MKAIKETNFQFPGQRSFYRGKVRDVYAFNDQLIMVASDRISAFDHILPKAIPYKGQVLNQITTYFLENTKEIVPNWLEASPDVNVAVGKKCEPIKIEMVIRGFLAGHAWRVYDDGKRKLCGVPLPKGMVQSDRFLDPIITPATKADVGHDEDISKEEIISAGIVSASIYEKLEQYTKELFQKGSDMALDRGLILVDTKYEFGLYNNEIYLIDEIHTPDSSRYFYREGYHERQLAGQPQEQLSKEFVREWLMENNFQGLEGQEMPEMPDDFVELVSNRYIQLYEYITGLNFVKRNSEDTIGDIEKNILNYLKK